MTRQSGDKPLAYISCRPNDAYFQFSIHLRLILSLCPCYVDICMLGVYSIIGFSKKQACTKMDFDLDNCTISTPRSPPTPCRTLVRPRAQGRNGGMCYDEPDSLTTEKRE
jgi:hypothetical protein